uniref:Letm1 RBD domain-containing protein n=1 Tax=Falco tinnunculus TaxID=100819 RepID=A0A8C4U8P4_FALTI
CCKDTWPWVGGGLGGAGVTPGLWVFPPRIPFPLFPPRYFFPRQLLIRYFWTPRQQVEFLDAYDAVRRGSYPHVLTSLALAARSLPEPQLREGLQELCAEVQRGRQPRVAQLYALRSLFAGSPLALSKLRVSHVKALSQVLFLTPHLPAFFLRHRLRSHVLEIRHLDRAMLRLGVGQLSEEELRAVRCLLQPRCLGRCPFPPGRCFQSPFSLWGP